MQNEDSAKQRKTIPAFTLLMGLSGQLLLVAMQSRLLVSRHPVQPILFFMFGVALLQPMFAFYAMRWADNTSYSPKVTRTLSTLRVQLLAWRHDLFLAIGLGILALFLGQDLPPLHPDATALNGLWLALSVPAVYCAGLMLGGRWMALFSTGFLATSSWGLALIKADGPYSLVVLIASLYLITLLVVYRWQANTAALVMGLLLFAGIWAFPLFIINGLLAVLVIVLSRPWRPRWRRFFSGGSLLSLLAVAVLIGIIIQAIRHDTYAPALTNPQFTFFESLSTSLLMFNLTSDPTPLHGIMYRPVLVPITAAAFFTGLMALAWRIYARRQWADTLPLFALVITLIPAALQLEPPVRYPDLQQAAAAVPVVMLIAGGGMACLCQMLLDKLDKLGVIFATVLLLVILTLCMYEAHYHYQSAIVPLLLHLSSS